MDVVGASPDLLASATALAGLVLIFLGNTVASYGQYPTEDQGDVRAQFARRGWFAFGAFVVCLCSALASLAAQELTSRCLGLAGVALLVLALILVAALGLLTVREIS